MPSSRPVTDMTPPRAAHALVFPWPLQGHINGMLHLAAGLARAGVHVTFLHTDHNLRRLGPAAAATHTQIRFASIPDGLPDDHPRTVADIPEVAESLRTAGRGAYRALLASLQVPTGAGNASRGNSDSAVGAGSTDAGGGGFPPLTCVVADGLLPFAIDAAEELGVPAIAFRTSSACSFLAYLSVPRLLELGELPFPAGGAGLDEPVRGVPGMENLLRRRDLPVQCRRCCTETHMDPVLQTAVAATAHTGNKARALVFNTAASLEGPVLARIAPHVRDVFAVGPLHSAFSPLPAASLWREDEGCVAWLDGQADRSVVYVSLGSLAVITRDQFDELLAGLRAAGYPFLWALRPGMVQAGSTNHAALQVQEATDAARGASAPHRVVPWAPQRDVLRHRAVGCFLTHAGWNSILEAAAEGTPMVCWPFFADQQVNSRFVAAVWGNGLDMKDACDRDVVARTVREAMESGSVRRAARALAQQVKADVADGGSSAVEFQRLVGFIKELS